MIVLDGVTKATGDAVKKRTVLKAAQVSLPSNRRIALLGPRGEDKRIFIDLLAGLTLPDAGRVIRNARVSFPVGHAGGFSSEFSVRLNVAHVARLYGAEVEPVVDFVEKISKLGPAYNKPYGDLSKSAKRDLSQILAFSIPFDVYLLNDDIVRSTRSNTEVRALFEARAKTSGMIIASQDLSFAREFCDMGLALTGGKVRLFEGVEQALAFVEKAAARPAKKQMKAKKVKKRMKAFVQASPEKMEKRQAKRARRRVRKAAAE
jgi:capsular polysaccharide transport system ATP-binding protein